MHFPKIPLNYFLRVYSAQGLTLVAAHWERTDEWINDKTEIRRLDVLHKKRYGHAKEDGDQVEGAKWVPHGSTMQKCYTWTPVRCTMYKHRSWPFRELAVPTQIRRITRADNILGISLMLS